jgi:hypothetical protein
MMMMMMMMNGELKITWKENSHGLFYSTIPAFPAGLGKGMKRISQNGQSMGQDFISEPPKYKAGTLTIQQ